MSETDKTLPRELAADQHAAIESVHRHIAELEDRVHALLVQHRNGGTLEEVCAEFIHCTADARRQLCDLRFDADLTPASWRDGVEAARDAVDRAYERVAERIGR